MDLYCRSFLASPTSSHAPVPDTVTLTNHSHSELSFLVRLRPLVVWTERSYFCGFVPHVNPPVSRNI